MFDDRLEIFSPGRLPNIVTLDNMKETRFSRNPRIARFLSEFGWVKELNEGVNRIYSEMQRFFLNMPKYSEPNNNAVLLVLENSITSRRLRANDKLAELFSEDIWMTLNVEEQLILHYVYDNNRITTKEAAKILNRSLNPTRNLLKDMQKQGLLSWCGLSLKDPKQYYTLAKELSL